MLVPLFPSLRPLHPVPFLPSCVLSSICPVCARSEPSLCLAVFSLCTTPVPSACPLCASLCPACAPSCPCFARTVHSRIISISRFFCALPVPSQCSFTTPSALSQACSGDEASLLDGLPLFPEPCREVPNPEYRNGFVYEWQDPYDHTDRKIRMKFHRILWVDSEDHHRLHLQPMINMMRQHGIIVDVAYGTNEAIKKLKASEVPLNFVLTSSVFVTPTSGPGGSSTKQAVREVDSGHHLLRAVRRLQSVHKYYFRTVCAITTVINSRERSTLYSEGCEQIHFDLHTQTFDEVMGVLCRVQRYSDRLCNALRAWQSRTLPDRKIIYDLIEFGINPNFRPNAWAPLHFLARGPGPGLQAVECMRKLFAAAPDIDPNIRTRYTTAGVEKGSSPLLVALLHANAGAAEELVGQGCYITQQSFDVAATDVKRMDSGLGNTQAIIAQLRANLKLIEARENSAEAQPHDMVTVLWISSSNGWRFLP